MRSLAFIAYVLHKAKLKPNHQYHQQHELVVSCSRLAEALEYFCKTLISISLGRDGENWCAWYISSDFVTALSSNVFDLILADYDLSGFDGLSTLSIGNT